MLVGLHGTGVSDVAGGASTDTACKERIKPAACSGAGHASAGMRDDVKDAAAVCKDAVGVNTDAECDAGDGRWDAGRDAAGDEDGAAAAAAAAAAAKDAVLDAGGEATGVAIDVFTARSDTGDWLA